MAVMVVTTSVLLWVTLEIILRYALGRLGHQKCRAVSRTQDETTGMKEKNDRSVERQFGEIDRLLTRDTPRRGHRFVAAASFHVVLW